MNIDENYNAATRLSAWWSVVKANFANVKKAVEAEISDRRAAVESVASSVSTLEDRVRAEINDRQGGDDTINAELAKKANKTQYASISQAGLVKLYSKNGVNRSGLTVDSGTGETYVAVKNGLYRDGAGAINTLAATAEEITAGEDNYKPIVPSTFPTAVSSKLGLNHGTAKLIHTYPTGWNGLEELGEFDNADYEEMETIAPSELGEWMYDMTAAHNTNVDTLIALKRKTEQNAYSIDQTGKQISSTVSGAVSAAAATKFSFYSYGNGSYDLDDINGIGVYMFYGGADAANAPSGEYDGTLFVLSAQSTGTRQIFITEDKIYSRYRIDSTDDTPYGAWTRLGA